MKFNINQQDLQQALNYCQGVIEKRNTLPILSNILLMLAKFLLLFMLEQEKNLEIKQVKLA